MTDRESGDAIDLASSVIDIDWDGGARARPKPPGAPERMDGITIGWVEMDRPPPHGGEMHPDGDELLVMISGRVKVILEDREPAREIELGPGESIIVPRGVWHRVLPLEPTQLIHMTPGPGGDHRPPA